MISQRFFLFLVSGTLVSIRLLLFHVYFLQQVARPGHASLETISKMYDFRYGQPPSHTKQALQVAVKDILRVQSWEYVVAH